MLDTNVAIHIRDGDAVVDAKVRSLRNGITLSILTRVELENGVYRDPLQAARRRTRVDLILSAFPVVEFDQACADAYRDLIAAVGYSRRKVLDRMIAAQALVHSSTLVTSNAADFRDVPGLKLLAW